MKWRVYLSQFIVRERFVEQSSRVGISTVKLADSPCPVALQLRRGHARVESNLGPLTRLMCNEE